MIKTRRKLLPKNKNSKQLILFHSNINIAYYKISKPKFDRGAKRLNKYFENNAEKSKKKICVYFRLDLSYFIQT